LNPPNEENKPGWIPFSKGVFESLPSRDLRKNGSYGPITQTPRTNRAYDAEKIM